MNPLNFPIQKQLCTEWCWASVAASVCACFNDSNAPDQRGIVSLVINQAAGSCNCDLYCNQPKDLDFVLAKIQHLGAALVDPSFDDITGEIESGNPIVVQVDLPELAASSHAVAIFGYTEAENVLIADPWNGDKVTIALGDLLAGSSSTFQGRWRTGYRTIPL